MDISILSRAAKFKRQFLLAAGLNRKNRRRDVSVHYLDLRGRSARTGEM
jgi:hypothetical protein